MVLPIYIYGSPVLRTKGEAFDPRTYPDFSHLVENMFDTMHEADGVGIAAQQVGLAIRLFCIDLTPYREDFPEGFKMRRVFINADILERSEDCERSVEGCLSLPGLNEDVVRPEKIRIRYMDEDFAEHDEWFDGYLARVIQHEYDHIEGIVFSDRVSPLRKQLIKRRLSEMSKGHTSAHYKTKLGR